MSKGLKPEDKHGLIGMIHYYTREPETILCMEKLREWTLLNGYKIKWANTWGDAIPQGREKIWLELSEYHVKKIEVSPGEYESVLDMDKAKFQPSWILYIDADNVFEPEWLERLLRHNVDIVGHGYVSRNKMPIPTASYLTNGRVYPVITGFENGGLKEVDALGFGFTLIRRSVIDRLPWPWFKYETIAPGIWVSEDMYFCTKAKQYGFKVYADWDLRVGHIYRGIRTLEHFRAVQDEVMRNSEENLRVNKEKYGLTDDDIQKILQKQ